MNIVIENAILFAEYAGDDQQKWIRLLGWPILHKTFGPGRVTRVQGNEKALLLTVHFDSLTPEYADKLFDSYAFAQGFFIIETLPEDMVGIKAVRQQIEIRVIAAKEQEERQLRLEVELQARLKAEQHQREQEAEATQHFQALQEKYKVHGYQDESPSSPLYTILLKIEAGERFSKDDVDWLDHTHIYHLLAIYHEQRYKKDGDLWDVAKAGKYWRMAGKPDNVLKIPLEAFSDDIRANSAVLTNRGAAMRDLGQLDEARRSALAALEQDHSSYHAYNLLGGIYFQAGDLERGDEFFAKAMELGAPVLSQEEALKSAIQHSGEDDRERTAHYLLAKDPKKYIWAQHYLKKPKTKRS